MQNVFILTVIAASENRVFENCSPIYNNTYNLATSQNGSDNHTQNYRFAHNVSLRSFILHLLCDHRALRLCRPGADLVYHFGATSLFNDSIYTHPHAYIVTHLGTHKTPCLFM